MSSDHTARRAGQQPLSSLFVLAALGVGTALVVIEVLALWPTLLMAHVEYWEDAMRPRVLAETLTSA